jgi:PAS domain S-box-containing protein
MGDKADERLFHGAFMASPIGIALENLEGRPLFANPALCSMLGFTEEELRNKHCVELSPPEDAKKDWALFEQLRVGAIDHYQLEKRFFRRDGSLISGRLTISLLENGASRFVVAMVEDLSAAMPAENLAGRLIQAQEKERSRIARELHDDIHQQLVLLSIGLDRLQANLPESTGEIRQRIREANEQLVSVSKDIHALSHRLHSARLEYLGLAAAASSLCRELSTRNNVKIAFYPQDIPAELPTEISLCLYRVLQEALQNAIKHSGSGRVEVSLGGEGRAIQLAVRDWGIGFDLLTIKNARLGLASMRERLILVGGDLSVESERGVGTTILARVTMKDQTNATTTTG